jgi:hypothetical protein
VDALPIPGEWITQGGSVGLLGVVVLLILSGRIVPRSTYRSLERDRDHWREAAMKAIGHTEQLLPAAQITTEMVTALAGQAASKPPPDPHSAAAWKALGGRDPQ